MSHASSLEKSKLGLKKARKFKKEKQLQENKLRAEMGEEEYRKLVEKRFEKTTKDEVTTAIWDYRKRQYPRMKYDYLKDLLQRRLKEIGEPESMIDIIEKNEIEGILNELKR